MTPERLLWQSVVMRALRDTTSTGPGVDVVDMQKADKWIRRRGKEYRMVCDLAGMDPDFIADAYVAGRIDAGRLRRMEGAA
jgi:hypothetical protein